ASPDSIADASGVGPQRDRAHRERADGDADRDAAGVERVLHVVWEHRSQHREREEIAEPRGDDDEEARREQPRRRGSWLGHWLASCKASSHDPRSAIIRRYCITKRGRLKPSAPTSRPRRPNNATN